MSTNIGESTDPFYRYRRPISQVENKGKTTSILNLEEIAKSLHTKSKYILYYVQLEKSIPVQKNEIKTVLSHSQIEQLINQFIDKYIICSKCKYPELIIKANGKKLCQNCEACGHCVELPNNKFTKIIHKDYIK